MDLQWWGNMDRRGPVGAMDAIAKGLFGIPKEGRIPREERIPRKVGVDGWSMSGGLSSGWVVNIYISSEVNISQSGALCRADGGPGIQLYTYTKFNSFV